MVAADFDRNFYEEHPDECKELWERSEKETGEIPGREPSRDELLKQHERHLQFLKSGPLPPRTFVLPFPYPPSPVAVLNATWIQITDLKIGSRKPEEFLLVRSIVDPYVYSSSITVVEDERGGVARLTVYNLEDLWIDPVITKEAVIAIKQPCWSPVSNGGYHIRVDHPSDLVLLDPTSKLVPLIWKPTEKVEMARTAEEWKTEGSLMFLKKKFRRALDCYKQGISILRLDDPNATELIDFYRKSCGVNIILLRLDDAADDLTRAASIFAASPLTHQAADHDEVAKLKTWLHSHSVEDPSNIFPRLPKPLQDLAARIRFDLGILQTHPDYDLPKFSANVGPLNLYIDAASYTAATEIKRTSDHGRGLFAKRSFKAGDLIMAEKAFALPGFLVDDRGCECSLYSLDDATTADRAGALLFCELVQKLDANPSVRKIFFDMDDGGYWEKHGWEVAEDEDIPVDVFRVEHIRRRNCFAAPIRAIDVLKNSGAAIRNGFWIHTSYINHSCLPNSVRTFLGDILFLRATRDVATGEEITAQYITPDLRFEDRQEKYKQTWGFECDCRLCEGDKKVDSALERQRMAIFEELKASAQKLGHNPPTVTALKKFAKRLRELEVLYDGETHAHLPKLFLVHPTLFLTEAWRSLKNVDRMMENSNKLLRNFGIKVQVNSNQLEVLENNGLINVECVRALRYLFEGYTSKGQVEVASSIKSTAQVWFRIITGADVGSEEFLQM